MSGRVPDPMLVWQQTRYQNKIFWRTPVAAFFTLVFPLMFLVLFTAIFGNDLIDELGVTTAQFYAPALAVFGAASATYTNLGVQTAMARDQGILKRIRGTPLPPWIYMAGRVGSAVWLALLAVLLMMAVGVLVYDVEVFARTLPAAAVSFVAGVVSFAALGLAVAALAPTGDSAPAITNATLLPVAFVSDVFIVTVDAPEWMRILGNIFPLKHFVAAFGDAFNPTLEGSGFAFSEAGNTYAIGGHVLVMLLWALVGVAAALRFFQWEPRGGERSTKRSRRKAST